MSIALLANDMNMKQLLESARITESTERYEDMCKFVKRLVELKSAQSQDLSVDERNLLSVAYKNVVGARRASWRVLTGGVDETDNDLLNMYKPIIERELEAVCNEVLNLLTKHLLANVASGEHETRVFYLKMCADYYRYLCEFRTDEESYKQSAQQYYVQATEVAEAHLSVTHPTRLGLALNFSVCCYEILEDADKACDLAKKAFDCAIEKLDSLTDESYKDSTLIMQLLRDNLTLWTSQ